MSLYLGSVPISFPSPSKSILRGTGFFFLMHSFVDISSTNLYFAIFAFAFSISVGYFLVFIPSGLGVNEGLLVLSLVQKGLFGLEIATVISLVTRVWMIVNDLIFLAISWALNRLMDE